MVSGTPEEQKERSKMLNFYAEKQKPIEKLAHFLSAIEPALIDLLKIEKEGD